MAEKQPLNATFFALRKRDQGGVIFRATLAFLIVAIVLIAAFIAVFWASLVPAIEWYISVIQMAITNTPPPQPDMAALSSLGWVVLGLIVWSFFFYLLFAAYEAGCLRWMIHGEVKGFMGLSLGAPTWRVWSCYWIWFLLHMGFSIVMSVIMMFALGILAVRGGGDPTAAMTIMPAFYLLQYGLMIYFGVRLAPAAASSIARRRFSFFHAWAVTRDRFWALLGSFFIIYLLYFIASAALVGIWFGSVVGTVGPDWAAIGSPEQAEAAILQLVQEYLRSLTQPQNWVVLGLLQIAGLIFAAFFYVASFGINARAAVAAMEEGKIQPAA